MCLICDLLTLLNLLTLVSLRAPSVCLICLPYISSLYVFLICLPYVSSLCVCLILQVAAGEVAMLASEREVSEEREEEMRQHILKRPLYSKFI